MGFVRVTTRRFAAVPLAAIVAASSLALGVWLSASAAPAEASRDCTIEAVTMDAYEWEFLALINNYRQQNGRTPLTPSYNLTKAAAYKSWDMGTYNYFGHDDLDRTWIQRVRDCNYRWNTYVGENIAAGYTTAVAVFEGWRNSPGHNSNMLSTSFTAIGIGRHQVPGSTFGVYWTTVFGGTNEGWAQATDVEETTPIDPPTPPPAEHGGVTGDAASTNGGTSHGGGAPAIGLGSPHGGLAPVLPPEHRAEPRRLPDPGPGPIPWWFRLRIAHLHF